MLYSTGAFAKQLNKRKAVEVSQSQGVGGANAGVKPASPRVDSNYAYIDGSKQFVFIKRQAVWILFGSLLCLLVARSDYHLWERYWPSLFVITVILLCLVYAFPSVNGSRRWIKVWGETRFQPSELGKLAVVVFLAAWLSRHAGEIKRFTKGIAIPLAAVGLIMGLIVFEVDLGATALIGATALCLMFVAGSNFLHVSGLVLVAACGLWFSVQFLPGLQERKQRVEAFFQPEGKTQGVGMQQHEALIALGSGGVEGLGLGNGRQKMQFLPEAHTDFIFPMIGEELGLRFTLLIVSCYVVLIICGAYISVNARDRFGMLLGFGIVTLIALQAAVNIGVTTSLLPNKGMPLPFISYGGSNLMLCLVGIGILLSIYRQGRNENTVANTVKQSCRITPRI